MRVPFPTCLSAEGSCHRPPGCVAASAGTLSSDPGGDATWSLLVAQIGFLQPI